MKCSCPTLAGKRALTSQAALLIRSGMDPDGPPQNPAPGPNATTGCADGRTSGTLQQRREQGDAGGAREERARRRLAQQLGQAGDGQGHAARGVAGPPAGMHAWIGRGPRALADAAGAWRRTSPSMGCMQSPTCTCLGTD